MKKVRELKKEEFIVKRIACRGSNEVRQLSSIEEVRALVEEWRAVGNTANAKLIKRTVMVEEFEMC